VELEENIPPPAPKLPRWRLRQIQITNGELDWFLYLHKFKYDIVVKDISSLERKYASIVALCGSSAKKNIEWFCMSSRDVQGSTLKLLSTYFQFSTNKGPHALMCLYTRERCAVASQLIVISKNTQTSRDVPQTGHENCLIIYSRYSFILIHAAQN
jgi:hypothetical protein